MSAGPIQRERDAWKRPDVSTTEKDRRCMKRGDGRGYCGRRGKATAESWPEVVCADCIAAAQADGVRLPMGVSVG